MNHDRLMALSVFADVFEAEARRQIEVELDGRELPEAAQDIDQLDVDLGAVERRFAGDRLVGNALGLQHIFQRPDGEVPVLVRTDVMARSFGSQVESSTLNSWKPKVFSTVSAKSIQAT